MIQTPPGLGSVAVAVLILVQLCGAGPSFGAEMESVDTSGRESFRTELQKIRESAQTPEEMVAKVDELLCAQPRPVPENSKLKGKRPMPAFEDRVLTEDEALRQEARTVLWETRESARTPEEEVALVDEFLRINKETLASLRPKPPSEAEKEAAGQTRKQMLESRIAESPDDLIAQAALMLWEVRQEAKSPEESVALVDEFLKLNRETLEAEKRKVLGNQFLNQMKK